MQAQLQPAVRPRLYWRPRPQAKTYVRRTVERNRASEIQHELYAFTVAYAISLRSKRTRRPTAGSREPYIDFAARIEEDLVRRTRLHDLKESKQDASKLYPNATWNRMFTKQGSGAQEFIVFKGTDKGAADEVIKTVSLVNAAIDTAASKEGGFRYSTAYREIMGTNRVVICSYEAVWERLGILQTVKSIMHDYGIDKDAKRAEDRMKEALDVSDVSAVGFDDMTDFLYTSYCVYGDRIILSIPMQTGGGPVSYEHGLMALNLIGSYVHELAHRIDYHFWLLSKSKPYTDMRWRLHKKLAESLKRHLPNGDENATYLLTVLSADSLNEHQTAFVNYAEVIPIFVEYLSGLIKATGLKNGVQVSHGRYAFLMDPDNEKLARPFFDRYFSPLIKAARQASARVMHVPDANYRNTTYILTQDVDVMTIVGEHDADVVAFSPSKFKLMAAGNDPDSMQLVRIANDPQPKRSNKKAGNFTSNLVKYLKKFGALKRGMSNLGSV